MGSQLVFVDYKTIQRPQTNDFLQRKKTKSQFVFVVRKCFYKNLIFFCIFISLFYNMLISKIHFNTFSSKIIF